MKKFTALVFATLMATTITTAAVGKPINTFLYAPPGGTYDLINQQLIVPVLGSQYGKTVNLRGCSQVKNYIENTNEKIFGMWDLENNILQSSGKQNPCYMPSDRIIGVAVSFPFYACHRKGDKHKGLSDFITNPNIKVGVNGNSAYYAMAKSIMNDLNSQARLIPYNSSTTRLPALASGEVDYLLGIQRRDNMTCFASTHDKNIDGMQALSELSNNAWANRGLLPVFIYKNMTSKEAADLYHKIVNSNEYNSLINVHYQKPNVVDLSRSEQMQILKDYQQDLLKIIK